MRHPDPESDFDLTDFFPYQVRIYYRAITDAISRIYKSMFDLSVSEWRVMAVLSSKNVLSASQIVARSSMTKVNVSRAIKSLKAQGLLKRDINGDDKRFAALRLTEQGVEVFNTLLPHILLLEEQMFKGFTPAERADLIAMMARVRRNLESPDSLDK